MSSPQQLRSSRLQAHEHRLSSAEQQARISRSIDYHDAKLLFQARKKGYDAAYLEQIYFANTEEHELMPISVSRSQGKFLYLQTRALRAKKVLEVGMLGGYSTLWMAYGLPPDGTLVAFDIDPHAAQVARANFDGAGADISRKISIVVGPAAAELAKVPTPSSRAEEWDLVFIDADKEGYPAYFREAKRLAPHGLIVLDNMVQGGSVADEADARGKGQRAVLDLIETDPDAEAVTLHAISDKSIDGFTCVLLG